MANTARSAFTHAVQFVEDVLHTQSVSFNRRTKCDGIDSTRTVLLVSIHSFWGT